MKWRNGRDAFHIPWNYDSKFLTDTTEHADWHKGLVSLTIFTDHDIIKKQSWRFTASNKQIFIRFFTWTRINKFIWQEQNSITHYKEDQSREWPLPQSLWCHPFHAIKFGFSFLKRWQTALGSHSKRRWEGLPIYL